MQIMQSSGAHGGPFGVVLEDQEFPPEAELAGAARSIEHPGTSSATRVLFIQPPQCAPCNCSLTSATIIYAQSEVTTYDSRVSGTARVP